MTKNYIAAAFAGSVAESIGYYGFIAARDFYESKKKGKINVFKNVRNLLVEFGFSEALDTLIIRPFFMYLFPVLLGNFAIGIILGKIAADITFYVPTIIAYELRKRYLK